jgi:hypothetical protein
MSLVRLTDQELDAVFESARVLPPRDRDLFLQLLAQELDKQQELGPGLIARIARDLQRSLFAPPLSTVEDDD